jgi:hypothetical protein
VIQTQTLQDRNVPDRQQWESATKFMENVLRKELEREESELLSNINQNSWKKFLGFQRSTKEEKYRQQCAKELDRVFISRRQLDQSMKNNQVVGDFILKY